MRVAHGPKGERREPRVIQYENTRAKRTNSVLSLNEALQAVREVPMLSKAKKRQTEAQFSKAKPGTRSNSLVLFVTSTSSSAKA